MSTGFADEFLAYGSSSLELLDRFDDDRAKWMQLIRLARLDAPVEEGSDS